MNEQAHLIQNTGTSLASRRERVPLSPTESSEVQAVCFFFTHIQPRMTGYWTEDLPMMYTAEHTESVLKKAALSVAYVFTSLNPRRAHFKALAISEYIGALRLVKAVIEDPVMAYSDALIMAILCLGLWEVS